VENCAQNAEIWPPALSVAEEIFFVSALQACTSEAEIDRRVLVERQRRLQRPNFPPGFGESLQIEFCAPQSPLCKDAHTQEPGRASFLQPIQYPSKNAAIDQKIRHKTPPPILVFIVSHDNRSY
jgi:hypothetical protein